jgi:hypothetical protein
MFGGSWKHLGMELGHVFFQIRSVPFQVRMSGTEITMTKSMDDQIRLELKKLEHLVGVWQIRGWTRELISTGG